MFQFISLRCLEVLLPYISICLIGAVNESPRQQCFKAEQENVSHPLFGDSYIFNGDENNCIIAVMEKEPFSTGMCSDFGDAVLFNVENNLQVLSNQYRKSKVFKSDVGHDWYVGGKNENDGTCTAYYMDKTTFVPRHFTGIGCTSTKRFYICQYKFNYQCSYKLDYSQIKKLPNETYYRDYSVSYFPSDYHYNRGIVEDALYPYCKVEWPDTQYYNMLNCTLVQVHVDQQCSANCTNVDDFPPAKYETWQCQSEDQDVVYKRGRTCNTHIRCPFSTTYAETTTEIQRASSSATAAATSAGPVESVSEEKSSKESVYIGIILGVAVILMALIIAVVVLCVYKRRKGSKRGNSSASASASASVSKSGIYLKFPASVSSKSSVAKKK